MENELFQEADLIEVTVKHTSSPYTFESRLGLSLKAAFVDGRYIVRTEDADGVSARYFPECNVVCFEVSAPKDKIAKTTD